MDAVEQLVTALPVRGRQAELAARLEDRNAMAKRALGYVELYGAYTETEARYRIDRLLALGEGLDEADRRAFCFDPAVIDWDHYVHDVHLPSVIEHARVRTSPGKSVVDKRPERARRAILSPDRHLAVFDLEHTLIASNVVDTYAWLASRHLPAAKRAAFVAGLLRDAPSLLALDRRDRGDFLRSFYRRYEDAPVALLAEDSWELFHRQLLTRSFPAGFARVREHRRLGHRTLLITGALDFVIAPLRPLFDDIVCARLGQRRRPLRRALGRAAPHRRGPGPTTGRLRGGPRPLPGRVSGLRRLGQRPGHARGGRLPGGRQPRVPPGGHRPPPGLARRALVQGPGGVAPAPAPRAPRRRAARWRPAQRGGPAAARDVLRGGAGAGYGRVT